MENLKRCAMGLAVAAVLFLGARPSRAQTGYWPNNLPYACTWVLSNGSTGVSLVTISLAGSPTTTPRTGTITNVYATGSPTTKPVTMGYDILVGGFYFRSGDSSNPPIIDCHVETYSYGKHLVFSQCSNLVQQDCRQWGS
jgi:hypothetical protein